MSYDDENISGENERRRRSRSGSSRRYYYTDEELQNGAASDSERPARRRRPMDDESENDGQQLRRRSRRSSDESGRANADEQQPVRRRRSAEETGRVNADDQQSARRRRRPAEETGRVNADDQQSARRRRSAEETGRVNADDQQPARRRRRPAEETGRVNADDQQPVRRRRPAEETGRVNADEQQPVRRRRRPAEETGRVNTDEQPARRRRPENTLPPVPPVPPNGPQYRNAAGKPVGACKFVAIETSVMTLLAAVFFAVMVLQLGMLNTLFTVIFILVLAVLTGVVWFLNWMHAYKKNITQRKQKVTFVLSIVFAVIFTIVFVVGGFYIFKTGQMLRNNSGVTTETSIYGVYVLSDDDAEALDDAKNYTFGILETQDRDNIETVINDINEELGTDITTQEYPGMTGLADALRSGEVQAIILGESFMDMFESFEGYETFATDTRCIWTDQVVNEVETVSEDMGEVVTIYVSGSDTRSDTLPARSLSDVNIILSMNMTTHQALILSTPRDYYVTTPVSGSTRDKLTQAGAYGVENSMGALEDLYGCDIDYYARVNFTGFIDIVDALGGIDVWSDYTFTSQNMAGYTFSEGTNHMDGSAALAFCRERYSFSDGDNQRGRNQMEVLKGIINKCTDPSILANYLDVIDSVDGCFETNMPYSVMAELVRTQLDYGGDWDIITYAPTGTGDSQPTYSSSSYSYVMYPDQDMVDIASGLLSDMEAGQTIVDPDETAAAAS